MCEVRGGCALIRAKRPRSSVFWPCNEQFEQVQRESLASELDFEYYQTAVPDWSETPNIYNRIANHRSSTKWYNKDLHIVHIQICKPCSSTRKELREWEVNKIKQHDPKFNKYKGGNGREPAKLWYNGEVVEICDNQSISDVAESIGFLRRVLDVLHF